MTVCIAQMINWKYGENDMGRAILTASDREITAGDVEYEPNQQKICYLSSHIMLLIAGDFSVHTEAMYRTSAKLKAEPQKDPRVVAQLYADAIAEVKRQQAERVVLSPLGLTLETFLSRQREFSPEFADRITNQLQNYQGADTEALVVGMNDKLPHICVVDSQCQVTCHDDVGFAAIGIGAWHAKSAFMQARYTNTTLYLPAFALLYLAKKRAEIAPGVSKTTDYQLITRAGHEPVLPKLVDKTQELYVEFEAKARDWWVEGVGRLKDFLNEPVPQLEGPPSPEEAAPSKSPTTSSKDQT